MAASVASASCKTSVALASNSKLEKVQTIKSASLSSAFGLTPAAARVSCNLEENVRSVVDGAKAAALVLASSALMAGVSHIRTGTVDLLLCAPFMFSLLIQ